LTQWSIGGVIVDKSCGIIDMIGRLRFSPDGLIPAVVQDVRTGRVLMVAYMSSEAIRRTLETGRAWFWSRKRRRLWQKGESSGHVQTVRGVYVDCDTDTLLLEVEQTGVACHEGRYSCFHRKILQSGEFADVPDGETHRWETAASTGSGAQQSSEKAAILDEVYGVLQNRKEQPSPDSYTSRLMQSGLDRILRKVGEEAGEFIIAAKNGQDDQTVAELADLWFHSMVALAALGIPISRVYEELLGRRGRRSPDPLLAPPPAVEDG
jgi:phosphoribosyl-ATP pyrophosphohydrolase/phosphoribosyl-AMP cyclohydrolase